MSSKEKSIYFKILSSQRSHTLFVLSKPTAHQEERFSEWYLKAFRNELLGRTNVLNATLYEQHEIDITKGAFPRLDFTYLCICELSLDGAEAATEVIESIAALHKEQPAAELPATWLYYPASERVGGALSTDPPHLTIAFANAVPGREVEFREWYATRHIRHALNIAVLTSGQVFERTTFQMPGASPANFSAIAVYETDGTPQDFIRCASDIPKGGVLKFPALDTGHGRFSEWVYKPI